MRGPFCPGKVAEERDDLRAICEHFLFNTEQAFGRRAYPSLDLERQRALAERLVDFPPQALTSQADQSGEEAICGNCGEPDPGSERDCSTCGEPPGPTVAAPAEESGEEERVRADQTRRIASFLRQHSQEWHYSGEFFAESVEQRFAAFSPLPAGDPDERQESTGSGDV